MAEPTIAQRLRRRFVLMSTDPAIETALRGQVPDGWDMVCITDLDEAGDWHDVLMFRFLLLDLDETNAFDPLDVIGILRVRHMVNIPVFCFGGDEDLRDEMRLSRADRFLERTEIPAMLPRFLEQYRWGADE